MNALAFLRSEAAQRIVSRGAKASGVPLAIHHVERNQEGPRVDGCGGCAICAHVSGLEGGRRACRQSRLGAARMALEQDRAIVFVCHMGLACVTVPALPEHGFMLTLGPYCPMEADASLEGDVSAGLANLTETTVSTLPVSLEDIHRAPAQAVPEMAAWLREMLEEAWGNSKQVAPVVTPAESFIPPDTRPKRSTNRVGPAADEAALAFSGGNFKVVDAWLDGQTAESSGQVSRQPEAKKARLIAAVSALLEATSAGGLSTDAAWAAFPAFAARHAEMDVTALKKVALALLRAQHRAWKKQGPSILGYTVLNQMLRDRLDQEITLEEVARRLGETPSAISHRLRRKFGMSFSEYVSRLRTAKAKELLRRTRLSPIMVGRRVGVRDGSNFRKLFIKYEGMAPVAYRERYGKKR